MAVCAATAGAATASAAPSDKAGIEYLALGDSVVFGYRPSAITPPADYLNPNNFVGYPEYLDRLPGVQATNAACPGETTGSFIDVTAQNNGCETNVDGTPGYRAYFPLHVNYSGSQLDFAVQYLRAHPDTRVVSIGIGANDFFVCQQVNADGCTGADLTATLGQISANLTRIYSALREQAHYQGTLVDVSYYSLDYGDPQQVAVVQALNAAAAGPTKQFGGIIADGFGAFQLASKPAGGDSCQAGLLLPLPTGGCDEHPSARGQLLLAGAVALAVAGQH